MKTAQISAMLIEEMANGLSVKEAIDKVLGAGTYDKLAGDIWEALQ